MNKEILISHCASAIFNIALDYASVTFFYESYIIERINIFTCHLYVQKPKLVLKIESIQYKLLSLWKYHDAIKSRNDKISVK